MLPAHHRMRRSEDFTVAVRRGVRGGTGRVVVHRVGAEASEPTSAVDAALVGFVVPKGVGGAVERNLVKRRLRALMCERVGDLEAGARVVVRALPPARGSTFQELGADLDVALATTARRWRRHVAAGRRAR